MRIQLVDGLLTDLWQDVRFTRVSSNLPPILANNATLVSNLTSFNFG